jgi:hypothetical protein
VMRAEDADEFEMCRAAALQWSRRRSVAGERVAGERVVAGGVAGEQPAGALRTHRRLVGYLARRGFSPDAIREAVRSATGDDRRSSNGLLERRRRPRV